MDTQSTTTGRTLVSKLAAIMAEIGRIPKNGHNDHFNYDFLREADLVEAIRDKLAERHVIVIPTKKRTEVIEMAKVLRGGEIVTMKIGLLHVTYTFCDGDSGETIEAESVGEIEQDGGKGIYKAATGAKKYMLVESFLVSTGDDPEQADHQPQRTARTASQSQTSMPKKVETQAPSAKAPTKVEAASDKQIGYIEKLAKEKGLFDLKTVFASFGIQGQPTKADATKIIDQLKTTKPRPQAPAKTTSPAQS